MDSEVEKAELIQSVKALLIPLSLFLATIITSAGGFLVYNGYSVGFILMGIGLLTVAVAFVAAIKFQNKLRANGKYRRVPQPAEPRETTFEFGREQAAAGSEITGTPEQSRSPDESQTLRQPESAVVSQVEQSEPAVH